MKKKKMNRYSIEDQIERFGLTKEEAELKIFNIKKKISQKYNIYSISDQMKKFNISEEEAIEKIKQIKDVNVFSIEWQIKKFNITKEEAEQKIESIKNKLKESQSKMTDFDFNSMIPSKKEHWIKKGYSEEESIVKSNENIKQATYNCNEFVKDKSRNPLKYTGMYDTSIEYYLKKGYSVDESRELLKKRQTTFTLSKCIENYGEIDGVKKWKERQEKWILSLLNNGNLKNGYSKISIEMFYQIERKFNSEERKNIKCYNLNGEFFIQQKNTYYSYDFKYLNKIIEFNGDVFHGNPSIYVESDICINFKNKPLIARDLWQKDKIKIDLAKSNGFDVLVIWESEYKKNKENTIKRCLEFLNKSL